MQSLSSGLTSFLRQIAGDEELSLLFLKELWPRLVGPALSESLSPVSLKRNRLVIRVPSSVWEQQISELRGHVLEAINEFWGCRLVERLVIQIDENGKEK